MKGQIPVASVRCLHLLGNYLYVGGRSFTKPKDSHLCIINTEKFEIEDEIESNSQIKCIQPFNENKLLILGENFGHIEIFNVE